MFSKKQTNPKLLNIQSGLECVIIYYSTLLNGSNVNTGGSKIYCGDSIYDVNLRLSAES
jgi:hypothetical protein